MLNVFGEIKMIKNIKGCNLFKCRLTFIMILDAVILPLSLWAAFVLRFSNWWPAEIIEYWWLFVAAPLIASPIFIRNGLYRAVLIYMNSKAFYAIVKAVSLHAVVLMVLAKVVGIQEIPTTFFAIYWLVSLTMVGGSRAVLRTLLQLASKAEHSSSNVIIYGAGDAGAELAETLQAGHEYMPIAFIDDKRVTHGTEIRGLKVYETDRLDKLIENYDISQVLLAIPSAPRARRQEVVGFLEKRPVRVRTVPGLMDIVSGRSQVSDLREVGIEDILGREPVPPNEQLLSACITHKSVMVTGAGGSIGSELCRQIIKLNPSHLVLFEASEFGLYNIEKELREYCKSNDGNLQYIEIVAVLGTVTNQSKLELVLNTFKVQTLYHAAAYKHVPLVEFNPIEGVKNNVFGTMYATKAALEANIETFIMISTDKAVRPTNVMGATKRLAELVIQGLAGLSDTTQFSIVRFGNVLGSSGSVVPLFKKQIKNGGPITLTHPDMTRYFMTIPEAALLVIQAGSMGSGGDVFVLDMGEPVRIQDMARHMVALSGLTVRDENNPGGDINIEITNLRPGEKLYEELLIGDNVMGTKHPRIMRALEVQFSWPQITIIVEQIEAACLGNDNEKMIKILREVVDGYVPQCGIEDPIWLATHQEDKKQSVHSGYSDQAGLVYHRTTGVTETGHDIL